MNALDYIQQKIFDQAKTINSEIDSKIKELLVAEFGEAAKEERFIKNRCTIVESVVEISGMCYLKVDGMFFLTFRRPVLEYDLNNYCLKYSLPELC